MKLQSSNSAISQKGRETERRAEFEQNFESQKLYKLQIKNFVSERKGFSFRNRKNIWTIELACFSPENFAFNLQHKEENSSRNDPVIFISRKWAKFWVQRTPRGRGRENEADQEPDIHAESRPAS